MGLSAGGGILGPRLSAAQVSPGLLSECPTSLSVNGNTKSTGSGSTCPGGGPVQALTWLANHLNSRGLALQRGQLVITAATCLTKEIQIGDTIHANFGSLGSVMTTLEE